MAGMIGKLMRRRPSAVAILARGAAAGVAGVLAMRADRMMNSLFLPRGERYKGGAEKALNEYAHRHDMDPPKLATRVASFGAELAGGAACGVAYAFSRKLVRAPSLIAGPLLGGAMWLALAGKRGLWPRLGAKAPATMQTLDKTTVGIMESVALGCGTAGAYAALEGR